MSALLSWLSHPRHASGFHSRGISKRDVRPNTSLPLKRNTGHLAQLIALFLSAASDVRRVFYCDAWTNVIFLKKRQGTSRDKVFTEKIISIPARTIKNSGFFSSVKHHLRILDELVFVTDDPLTALRTRHVDVTTCLANDRNLSAERTAIGTGWRHTKRTVQWFSRESHQAKIVTHLFVSIFQRFKFWLNTINAS